MIQFMLIYFSSTVKQNNLCLFITLNPETNKQWHVLLKYLPGPFIPRQSSTEYESGRHFELFEGPF